MLVIVSDLHLTDGTSGETVRVGAFRTFANRLRDLAYDASWRGDGKYRPIDELHLVLLGDILDVIRSTKWLDQNGVPSPVRPWNDPNSLDFIHKVEAITAAILQQNAPSLTVLQSLNDGKTITIPSATGDSKPAHVAWEPGGAGRQPVTVHIHYVVGNHDWFYHLPGKQYDAIRCTIATAIGLATTSGQPFPHDPAESATLQQIYRDHQVFARHGDVYDSYNFEGNRDRSSLGDAVVVELIDRFGQEVLTQLGSKLPPETQRALKEIDNLRPTAIIPTWIDAVLERTCSDVVLRGQVRDLWNDIVDAFRRLDFVRAHHAGVHLFDRADRLAFGLQLSAGILQGNVTKLYSWLLARVAKAEGSYATHAAQERAFVDRVARCIVYGHTHRYEFVPLASTAAQPRFDQVYVNSGTWRPYHELAQAHPGDEQFVAYQVMSYLAFFRAGERGGRHFESWSGVLDPGAVREGERLGIQAARHGSESR